MACTHRSLWSRLRSLTLASALVALLAIPALVPAAGAQAEIETGVSDEGVEVSASGGFDVAVVVDFSSASVQAGAGVYTLRVAGTLNGFDSCLEGWVPVQYPVNPALSCLPDRLAAPH